MNCSLMWKCCGRLALGLVAGGLLSACGAGSIVPQSTGSESSDDPAAAALKTQQEFDAYWASQRQIKETGSAAAPEPVAVPEVASEAAPQVVASEPAPDESNSRRTFSQWWNDKKKQKAAAQAAEAAPSEAPAPQVAEAAPQPAPVEEKKRRTFSQWWDDRKQQKQQQEEPQVAANQAAPAPQQAAAEAPQAEPEKEKYVLPIVTWFDQRKKNKQGGGSNDLAGIDLSGDFPTATPVKDWSGFVHSPYDSRFIDVKGVPSGTLVADPRYELSERKFFIVP